MRSFVLSTLLVVVSLAASSAAQAASPGRLAYSDGTSVFSVAATAGATPLRIGAGSQPQWSRDGKQIAWAGKGGVWTAQASGKGARLVIRDGSQPSWSPHGDRIAYVHGSIFGGLWTARSNGTAAQRLLSTGENSPFGNLTLDGDTQIFGVAWSPNGKQIGVVAWGTNGLAPPSTYLIGVSASGDHGFSKLVTLPSVDNGPGVSGAGISWSPNGSMIATQAAVAMPVPGVPPSSTFGPPFTALVRVAGHQTTFLAPPIPQIANAGYSPDGKQLCGSTAQGLATFDIATQTVATVVVPGLPVNADPNTAGPAQFTCSWVR